MAAMRISASGVAKAVLLSALEAILHTSMGGRMVRALSGIAVGRENGKHRFIFMGIGAGRWRLKRRGDALL
jgi:hypothetical protein